MSAFRPLRGEYVLPLAMFFGSFSWSFVYVSLPFHIQKISPFDEVSTLRWTGWILGISPLATVVTAPFLGRLGNRGNPKTAFEVIQYLQGAAFFAMAMARTLPEIFVSRLVVGLMGAASTFAFISAGRSDDPGEVRRQVATMQSAMTVGGVIGPLCGAIAAARLGFRASFVAGGLVLLGCGALVRWGVPNSEARASGPTSMPPRQWRETILVSLLVLGGPRRSSF